MDLLQDVIKSFSALFTGNKQAYGVSRVVGKAKEGEKVEADCATVSKTLTEKAYIAHLHGKQGLGIVPVDQDGCVHFAVIDVDVYDMNPVTILTAVSRAKLPLVGFRSKSGGMHLYVFFSKREQASAVIPVMREISNTLSFSPKTEIFPKQASLDADAKGNWINLPYFSHKVSNRFAYNLDGTAMPLQQALTLCSGLRVTLKNLKDALTNAPLAQAPVCLQTIFLYGGADEGERNHYLFNCAVYLKARFGEDFAQHTHKLNESTLAPLSYQEVDTTVIASHNKQDYTYKCTEPCLEAHCDKKRCAERKYGKAASRVSNLSFGKLVQIQTGRSNAKYQWEINEVALEFSSADELANQNIFRRLCMDNLRQVPNKLSDKSWLGILRRAFEQMVVVEEKITDDQENSLWLIYAERFFERRFGIRPEQMEDGYVYYDHKVGDLFFKLEFFVQHMLETRQFDSLPKNDHAKLLRKLGGRRRNIRYPGTGSRMKRWAINLAKLHEKDLFLNVKVGDFEEPKNIQENMRRFFPARQEEKF